VLVGLQVYALCTALDRKMAKGGEFILLLPVRNPEVVEQFKLVAASKGLRVFITPLTEFLCENRIDGEHLDASACYKNGVAMVRATP
jgi:hypothetical protein